MKKQHSRKPARDRYSRTPVIVFEDRDIILINKPAGLLTVPFRGAEVRSAFGLVNDYLEKKKQKAFVVHRIDRYTSGLVLFAKNNQARDFLVKQALAHTMNRRYLALVKGKLKPAEGELTHYLRINNRSFKQTLSRPKAEGSAKARLIYKTQKCLGQNTLVEVTLDTGLKNQIRAQFAAIGHPLVGDKQYGEKEMQDSTLNRQALHAACLGFIHPRSKEYLEFTCEPPQDLKGLFGRF